MDLTTFMQSRYKALDYALSQAILAEKFTLKNFPQGKKMVLWVGAKGSGKSTYLANAYENNIFDMPYIGSDILQQKVLSKSLSQEQQRSFANIMTQKVAENLIKSGSSFCIETSFDNPKLLDTIKSAKQFGYNITVFYVMTPDFQTNYSRIKQREQTGGPSAHPNDVLLSQNNIKKYVIGLIECCDKLYMVDNSKELPQTKQRIKNQEKTGEGFCRI